MLVLPLRAQGPPAEGAACHASERECSQWRAEGGWWGRVEHGRQRRASDPITPCGACHIVRGAVRLGQRAGAIGVRCWCPPRKAEGCRTHEQQRGRVPLYDPPPRCCPFHVYKKNTSKQPMHPG